VLKKYFRIRRAAKSRERRDRHLGRWGREPCYLKHGNLIEKVLLAISLHILGRAGRKGSFHPQLLERMIGKQKRREEKRER